MVIERLMSIKEAVNSPHWMFVVGGIVSVTCLVVSFLVFDTSIGMFFTFLVTIAMMPFMVKLNKYEEDQQEEWLKRRRDMNLFQRNADMLKIYTAFFAGMIVSLSIIYFLLPNAVVERLFDEQIAEINAIRGKVAFSDTFLKIVFNNLSVLMLSFFFSFLFGAGAVFILAWNASILSTAIGLLAKSIGGFKALPMAVLVFLPHGSLEIMAYFIGGIAGGLVSAVISRRHTAYFWPIVRDSLSLMVVSILLLMVGGFVESIQIVA